MSEYQFARLTGFHRLQCIRVDDFREVMVFIQVSPVLTFALVPDTRSGNLTQSINIVCFDSQLFFYLMTHIFRPGFCTESTDFQLEFFTWQTGIFDCICQIKRIGRSTTKHCRSEIVHQGYLFFRVTTGHRNNRSTDIFGSCMCSQSAREQSVSIRYLKNIRTPRSISGKSTRYTFRPCRQVLTGISDNRRFSGCSGRSMNTYNLAHRHGTKSERIIIS